LNPLLTTSARSTQVFRAETDHEISRTCSNGLIKFDNNLNIV